MHCRNVGMRARHARPQRAYVCWYMRAGVHVLRIQYTCTRNIQKWCFSLLCCLCLYLTRTRTRTHDFYTHTRTYTQIGMRCCSAVSCAVLCCTVPGVDVVWFSVTHCLAQVDVPCLNAPPVPKRLSHVPVQRSVGGEQHVSADTKDTHTDSQTDRQRDSQPDRQTHECVWTTLILACLRRVDRIARVATQGALHLSAVQLQFQV